MKTLIASLALVLLVGVAAFAQCPGGICYPAQSYYGGYSGYGYTVAGPRYVQAAPPQYSQSSSTGGYGGAYQSGPPQYRVQQSRYGKVAPVPVTFVRK